MQIILGRWHLFLDERTEFNIIDRTSMFSFDYPILLRNGFVAKIHSWNKTASQNVHTGRLHNLRDADFHNVKELEAVLPYHVFRSMVKLSFYSSF
jgi:hypothetical protein